MKLALRIFAALMILGLLPAACWAANSVEIQLVPASRAPFNATQEWARTLAKLKSVRVQSGSGRARPEVKRTGSLVKITAIIDSNNKLIVPGRSFSKRQTSAIQGWVEQQRSGNDPASKEPIERFGLTNSQLKKAHEALKNTVRRSTEDKSIRSVIAAISRDAGLRVQTSKLARRAVGLNSNVEVEWRGFTVGTAMAAVLRPLELVVVPKPAAGGQFELQITTDEEVKEGWPVGWKSPLKDRDLVPKIYDLLPIEIVETPVAEIMTAITTRLEVPLFYDQALLDLKKIDPTKARVSFSSKQTFYGKVMSATLFEAKMKLDLRVDEKGKPFYWVSPLIPFRP